MNYDDDLERARTRRSRSRKAVQKRTSETKYTSGRDRSESDRRRNPRGNRAERELTIIGEGRARTRQTTDNNAGSVKAVGRNRGQSSSSRSSSRESAAATSSNSKGPKRNRKRTRRIIIIVVEILALLGILIFMAYSYINRKINLIQRLPFDENTVKNVELSDEKQEQMKGYWTVAVFGVDDRGSVIGKGTNADVNMICNINQDTGEIKMVSVYRDTYMNITDKNTYNKINQAYFLGGPEQAVKALNKNLDLNITDYATFNWKAVAEAINILGGVDVEITKSEFYYINAFITETVKATGLYSTHLKKSGMNHLDGVQAVAYGRLRLMDTDFQRTERQRKIISLAFDKAKKADWTTLNNIVETVFPQVATSIDVKDIADAAWNIKKYHIAESGGFPTNRLDANMGKKGACVIPNTLESNVIDLHKFLFDDQDYVPTETVRAYSKKIAEDYGSKPKATKATEKATEPPETEEESTRAHFETDPYELGTGESGSGVYGSTSAGESASPGRPGGDASGWETWGTDEYGNLIDPAWGSTTAPSYGSGGSTGPGSETTSPYETSSPYETPPAYETTTPYETGPAYPTYPSNPSTSTYPSNNPTPTSPNRPGGTTAPGTTGSPQNNAPGGGTATSPTVTSPPTTGASQTGPGGGNTTVVTPGTSAAYPGGGPAEVPGAGMN